jgi:hypothetical protein
MVTMEEALIQIKQGTEEILTEAELRSKLSSGKSCAQSR